LFYSLLDEKTKSLNITILFEYKHTVIGGGRHGRLSHEKKKITRDEADDHISYERTRVIKFQLNSRPSMPTGVSASN
jgi:hypothetical protein